MDICGNLSFNREMIFTDGDFSKLENILPIYFGTLIEITFGFPLNWNESRYDKLI